MYTHSLVFHVPSIDIYWTCLQIKERWQNNRQAEQRLIYCMSPAGKGQDGRLKRLWTRLVDFRAEILLLLETSGFILLLINLNARVWAEKTRNIIDFKEMLQFEVYVATYPLLRGLDVSYKAHPHLL